MPKKTQFSNSKCCVLGCSSRKIKNCGRKIFKIPKDPTFREVFRLFSKQGDFEKATVICSDHFRQSCFEKRNQYGGIKKDAVPTLYKRGNLTVEVTFDWETMRYSKKETLVSPQELIGEEEELLARCLMEKPKKKAVSTQRCFVLGCDLYLKDRTISRFRIPDDPIMQEVFKTFARRDSEYVVKDNTRICGAHFSQDAFQRRKSMIYLKKNAVPTLLKKGNETIELTFDHSVMHYLEENTVLKPAFDKDQNLKDLISKRSLKLKEVLKLCCFCLCEETNLIAVEKLRDYLIQPADILRLISTEINLKFSNLICEECFENVLSLDGFRKRCLKARTFISEELRELDLKIQEIRGYPMDEFDDDLPLEESKKEEEAEYLETSWRSEANSGQNTQMKTEEQADDQPMVTFYDGEKPYKRKIKEEIVFTEEIDHSYSFEVEKQDASVSNSVKDEVNNDDNQSVMDYDMNDRSSDINDGSDIEPSKNSPIKTTKKRGKYKKQEIKKSENFGEDVIQGGQKSPRYTYECFFCKQKFAGRTTYKKHDCPVREIACPLEGCGKLFSTQTGYSTHISTLHKLPRISRQVCLICNFSAVRSEEEFHEHCRRCNVKSVKTSSKKPVTCRLCSKQCKNPEALSAHMLFHVQNNEFSKSYVCERCGKDFTSIHALHSHKQSHKSKPSMNFRCDYCGKLKSNKIHLAKHFRTVHLQVPSPCPVCHKVFKNKTLLSCHMVYHDETKRRHYCSLCPTKGPWISATDLRRHQQSNHGHSQAYQCSECVCSYSTKKGLMAHVKSKH